MTTRPPEDFDALPFSSVRSEDVSDVVFAAAGAEVAGEDALALSKRRDLGGVMPVASGLFLERDGLGGRQSGPV